MADFNAYIYPNTSAEDDLARAAKNVIESALSETFSYPPMDSDGGTYHVEIDWSYPNRNDPDKQTFKNKFEDWTVFNASGNGVHLALSSNWGGGLADSGEGFERGWIEETEAVAGSPYGVTNHFKGIVIQEAYHPFINASHSDVKPLLGPSGDEHTLGTVTGSNDVTPMATSYTDEGYHATGSCSSNNNKSGYTFSPTSCTNKAIHQCYQEDVLNES